MSAVEALDRHDAQRPQQAPASLWPFIDAGALVSSDVHVALRLGRLLGDDDGHVLLAAALAVRAARLGSVCVELEAVGHGAPALDWPPAAGWCERLAHSPAVAVGEDGGDDRPLRLVGRTLYLDRYWREERQVAADLVARSAASAPAVDETRLAQDLPRLFPGADAAAQRLAGDTAVRRRLTVIAGGPGTGKTTTVTRILLLLDAQAAARGAPPPHVALAAPTGKAAARLEQAVHEQALGAGLDPATRSRLLDSSASTLHRLLGFRPGSRSRFRHDRANQLPHDVVVVDETSMVSLSLMARLLEAVREDARLILVGDPQQLPSVEVGAVLGDVVGPAADGAPNGAPIGGGIVVLTHGYRFGGAIAELAEAVRRGDADAAIAVLRAGHEDVLWLDVDPAEARQRDALAPVRQAAVAAGRAVLAAARAGDGAMAIGALGAFRLLCAHRRGPYGVAVWNEAVEGWLGSELRRSTAEPWYVGRPLLVTENDYSVRLYNGDTGVVVARDDGRPVAVFERQGGIAEISPTRLEAVATAHAMTIHKSQGSQLDRVAVVLPDPTSRVLTRQLLYTAVTRAREAVILAGTEQAIRLAVERPVAHASGLTPRLWHGAS